MNFSLFEAIGLATMDLSYVIIVLCVLIIALLTCVIILFVKTSKLTKTYHKFMTGKTVRSLEAEIITLFEDNKQMKEEIIDNKRDIRSIYKQLRGVYQKSSILRYDAFKEMGGKLSFCLVMLDQDNNGFILNSVHSSAGCYSYLKEIRGGRCAIDLGAEEQRALDAALNGEELN